jgi:hypothetical protein
VFNKPARMVIVLMISAVLFTSISFFVLHAQTSAGVACALPFEATVRQGPSTGTALVGTLNFTVDADGGITGTLAQDGQPDILVVGQAQGRAINLAFDLSTADTPGVFIFGVGTAIDPVDSELCGTALGGPFVGPAEGDSGDWGLPLLGKPHYCSQFPDRCLPNAEAADGRKL